MAQSIKPSRWAISVPAGVAAALGAGLILYTIVGPGRGAPEWITTVEGLMVLLLGTLATGMTARARTSKEWVQAGVLTFAGLIGIAIIVFVYAVSLEPPR